MLIDFNLVSACHVCLYVRILLTFCERNEIPDILWMKIYSDRVCLRSVLHFVRFFVRKNVLQYEPFVWCLLRLLSTRLHTRHNFYINATFWAIFSRLCLKSVNFFTVLDKLMLNPQTPVYWWWFVYLIIKFFKI